MNIKTCPECRGRGFIYQSDYDSLGRYVRNYRCTNGHKWKVVRTFINRSSFAYINY